MVDIIQYIRPGGMGVLEKTIEKWNSEKKKNCIINGVKSDYLNTQYMPQN